MRKFIGLACAATIAATLLPASAYAGGRHHDRYRHHAGYVRAAPVYSDAVYSRRAAYGAYAAGPVYSAGYAPNPLLYPVGGAIIGAVIGAAVCPPCSIAGSMLTSGGGALVGAGIGAVGGTVVGAAVAPTYYDRY